MSKSAAIALFCCFKTLPAVVEPSMKKRENAPVQPALVCEQNGGGESLIEIKKLSLAKPVRRQVLRSVQPAREPTSDTEPDEDEMTSIKTVGRGLDPRSVAELHRALGLQAVEAAFRALDQKASRDRVERLARKKPHLFSGLPPGVHPCDWQREDELGEREWPSMS